MAREEFMVSLRCVVAGSSIAMVMTAGAASGQSYPVRPVRIVTTEIGGGTDVAARAVAQGLSLSLGNSVIVDNRGAVIAQELVAKATPDGYTLLAGGTPFWIGPLLQKMPYDAVRDFLPIAALTRSPSVLMVTPSLPVKSVKELIALAKSKPGELNYASGLSGTAPHLAAELFKALADVNLVRITYKSSAAALNGLLGGETQLTFGSAGSAAPHVKAGRLRALGVASAQPSALVPDMPTIAATVPGYESANMNGIFAPARTPAAIIKRLNQEIQRILNTPAVKDKFFSGGVEVVGGSPEEFAATIKSEINRLGRIIKNAGINAE